VLKGKGKKDMVTGLFTNDSGKKGGKGAISDQWGGTKKGKRSGAQEKKRKSIYARPNSNLAEQLKNRGGKKALNQGQSSMPDNSRGVVNHPKIKKFSKLDGGKQDQVQKKKRGGKRNTSIQNGEWKGETMSGGAWKKEKFPPKFQ